MSEESEVGRASFLLASLIATTGGSMRDRAYRRHHAQRVKDKWCKIGRRWGITDETAGNGFWGWVVRTAENMPTCSSPWCCGNPRRRGDKTLDEKRAEMNEREQA